MALSGSQARVYCFQRVQQSCRAAGCGERQSLSGSAGAPLLEGNTVRLRVTKLAG